MNISSNFKRLAGASALALAAAFTTGCASGPSGYYSEGGDYNGQRTRIDNQQMDCTIVTERSGTLRGGSTTQVGDGTFSEKCVSSPHANQRQRGTDPIQREIENTKRNVTRDIGNEVRSVIRDTIRGFDF